MAGSCVSHHLTARRRQIVRPLSSRFTSPASCSTDLEIFKGYMGFRGVPGHEFVGSVSEGPKELRGKRVVGEINFACGHCESCGRGLGRHCPNRRVMGILDADGAFAEFVGAPVASLHVVPQGVSDEAAVFAEPLAAAFEILEQVQISPRDEVLVVGDGKLVRASSEADRRHRDRSGKA
jgi:threonine dehydrogenase-like Zn-dependent dehydrogenase